MKHKTHSPLALPFDEAIQPSRFLAQIALAGENQLRDQLVAHGNQAFGIAVAGAKFVIDSGTLHVVFEGGIPAGAKLMKSAGKAMPVLVDGSTHQIMKIGRVASKGRAAASIAANSALMIVEAAHMISGHDNAKRLKKVERSVDRLVHAHESELKSRLEAVYRYSKELIHDAPEELSEEDRRELHRQCRDLIELRARWRDDFRHRLSRIERAEAGWLDKILFRREKGLRKSRAQKVAESEGALEIVQLMHFSLTLQMALAGWAGKLQAFQTVTLEDECLCWKSLAEFGRNRAAEIAGDEGMAEFRRFLDALDELVEFWSSERWRSEAGQSNPHSSANGRQVGHVITVCPLCGTRNRLPISSPVGRRPICGRCKMPICGDNGQSDFLPPPREGWTVDAYAEARGINDQEAWHQLRRLCSEGKLAEERRDGVISYVEPNISNGP